MANITDKITNVSSGTRPVSTTVSTLRTTGATSLSTNDLTGWATDTAVHFITYKIDGQGKVIVGSQTDWKGIVSGTTINNLTVTGGTDSGNAVGDIVEILPTARYAKEIHDALVQTLNTDGTLQTGIVATAKIADSAVTSAKIADGTIATTKIADSAVTSSKVSLNLGYAENTTSQLLSSATALSGLSVTVSANGTQRIRIEAVINFTINANASGFIYVYEGSTVIKAGYSYSNSQPASARVVAYITPTSGSHTYFVKTDMTAGSMQTHHGDSGQAAFIDISAA